MPITYDQALAHLDRRWAEDGDGVLKRAVRIGAAAGGGLFALSIDGRVIADWVRGVAAELGISL
jgi:hypothetical protein